MRSAASRRLQRLERRRSSAGPCPACPPAAITWEDQQGAADAVGPLACSVCGRAVVRVILGYTEEASHP